MQPQRLKNAITDNPKKLGNLIDLMNLPSTLRDFPGKSQISRLGCFICVWSYIKTNNLQDHKNKNVVNCDEKLKSIFLLGKQRVELVELVQSFLLPSCNSSLASLVSFVGFWIRFHLCIIL